MKIHVADHDVTDTLGPELQAAAAGRGPAAGERLLSPQHSALSLREATSDTEFAERFIHLVRARHGLDPWRLETPAHAGPLGRLFLAVRRVLWRVLRYQHEAMAYQQGLLNELTAQALEFQKREHARALAQLEARIRELEEAQQG